MAGADFFVFPASPWEGDAHGRSWRVLTGEIALLEIQNVFAEVSICPERMKLLQKSSRETHFEATATCFEYSMESEGFPRVGTWESTSDPCGISRNPGDVGPGPRKHIYQRQILLPVYEAGELESEDFGGPTQKW